MSQMEAKQAASLIEKWITFYEMDDPQAWDRDDYKFIQQSCRTMRAAVQVLRGKSAPDQRKLADGLEEFIEDSFMDDPHEWEPENRAFVKQAMEALQYTVAQLRRSSTGGAGTKSKPATGAPQPRDNRSQQGKSAANRTNASKSAATKGSPGKPTNAKTASNPSTGNKTGLNKGNTNQNSSNKHNSSANKTYASKKNLSTTPATSTNRNDRNSGRGKNGGR